LPASLFKKGLSENPWQRRGQAAQLLTLTFEFESLTPKPYPA
jgi:hypothetical protein